MVEQLDEGDEKRVEYRLEPMNKRERVFAHELSDLYSIYSTGRDIEPNRYLLLIADKGAFYNAKTCFSKIYFQEKVKHPQMDSSKC